MGNMIVSPSAVKNIDSKVGDPSSASSVSGNDAFSKINTLNSKYPTRQLAITIPVGSVSSDTSIEFSGANNYRWFATIQAVSAGEAYSGVFIEYIIATSTGINVSANRTARNNTSTAITVNVFVFGVPNV